MVSELLQQQLKPLVLLGGWNAAELWPSIYVVIASYALLIFVPKWKWTPTLTLITPIFHSIIYVGSLFSLMSSVSPDEPQPDFNTLDGVVTMFQDPNIVFVGWVHYIVFDLLVARMECIDSIQRGSTFMTHIFVVVPCMILTCMLGPTGFLLYMILRNVFLPSQQPDNGDASKLKIL